MASYNYQGPEQFRPLSPWAYFGYSLLYSIPIVGFIMLIINSVNDSNINRRNFTRMYWLRIRSYRDSSDNTRGDGCFRVAVVPEKQPEFIIQTGPPAEEEVFRRLRHNRSGIKKIMPDWKHPAMTSKRTASEGSCGCLAGGGFVIPRDCFCAVSFYGRQEACPKAAKR
jgi:hypothetical protein